MPAYTNSIFQPPTFLQMGVPCYLFGTYNAHQANTKMQLSQVALATNVATVTGQIVEGEIPLVGSYISVIQTATGSGEFNVNRALVTAVSFNNAGFGTVSYALTASNVTAVADFGTAIIEVKEIPETLTAVASVACAVAAPISDSQFTITTSVLFPTMPTAVTVVLQEAIRDVGGSTVGQAEYTTLGNAAIVASSAYTTGPTAQFTLTRGAYYRFLVSGITGSGTIVAKII